MAETLENGNNASPFQSTLSEASTAALPAGQHPAHSASQASENHYYNEDGT